MMYVIKHDGAFTFLMNKSLRILSVIYFFASPTIIWATSAAFRLLCLISFDDYCREDEESYFRDKDGYFVRDK
jgi:hypothetical protein